jgi:hypothetical protein
MGARCQNLFVSVRVRRAGQVVCFDNPFNLLGRWGFGALLLNRFWETPNGFFPRGPARRIDLCRSSGQMVFPQSLGVEGINLWALMANFSQPS